MPKHVRGHPHHHRHVGTGTDTPVQPDAARMLPLFWIGHRFGRSIYPPGWVTRPPGEAMQRVYLIYIAVAVGFILLVFGCAALASLAHQLLSLL